MTENGFSVPYLARISNETVIPIFMLSHFPALCFSWTGLAAVRDNSATFRTGLRREATDWPLVERILYNWPVMIAGFFTYPWARENP